MFCETGNIPAKLIKEFRKVHERPVLKAAFVEESIYLGDEQLETLSSLKSKNELIGDVVLLLQSPMKNLLSAMQSGGNNLAGVVQTLAEREG
jgi:large subunit ribosomal protein L10